MTESADGKPLSLNPVQDDEPSTKASIGRAAKKAIVEDAMLDLYIGMRAARDQRQVEAKFDSQVAAAMSAKKSKQTYYETTTEALHVKKPTQDRPADDDRIVRVAKRKESEERSISYEINRQLQDARQQETNFASGAPSLNDTRSNQEIVFLLNKNKHDPTRLSILHRPDDDDALHVDEQDDPTDD